MTERWQAAVAWRIHHLKGEKWVLGSRWGLVVVRWRMGEDGKVRRKSVVVGYGDGLYEGPGRQAYADWCLSHRQEKISARFCVRRSVCWTFQSLPLHCSSDPLYIFLISFPASDGIFSRSNCGPFRPHSPSSLF